jgi:hypothetical protein
VKSYVKVIRVLKRCREFAGWQQALKYRSVTDMERKPPDILSDQSETEVYCLSDPSVFVSDRTVALSDVNQNVL